MANTVAKIRIIALTMVQDILRRRVFYLAVVLAGLLLIQIFSRMVELRLAISAHESDMEVQLRAGFPRTVLFWWSELAKYLAVFLGATGISSEVNGRTIVHVFSRPVDRATYLTGRWLGLMTFLWCFQLAGVLLALLVTWIFGAHPSPLFGIMLASLLVTPLLYGSLSLSLNVRLTPVLAGAITIVLCLLPDLTIRWLENSSALAWYAANAVYYVAPAIMPVDLIDSTFTQGVAYPDYLLYLQVLGENILYAVAALVLASLVFARRELPMR